MALLLIARLGEGGFRAGFSVLSVVALVLLVMAWRGAETRFLWSATPWFRWLMAALMLPVLMLFFTSVVAPNPTPWLMPWRNRSISMGLVQSLARISCCRTPAGAWNRSLIGRSKGSIATTPCA